MKIFLGLLTPDRGLRRHFGSGQDKVVAREALARRGFNGQIPSLSLAAYSPDGQPSADTCERFLLGQSKATQACLLLIDQEWEFLARDIRAAILGLVFDRSSVGKSTANFFHKTTSRLLRAYRAVEGTFVNAEDAQALALPRRNFDAPELREIVRLCREACHEEGFHNLLQEQLKLLRRRHRPRQRSSFKTKYWVDDRRRFFEFGPEHHARFATGEPHRPSCVLNGYFRFGNRIDSTRHYNVSETEGDITTIEGEFDDCHDATRFVKADTHINMFSNDYFS